MNRTKKSTALYTSNFFILCFGSAFFFISITLIVAELPNYITSLGGEEYKGFIIFLFTVTALIARPYSGKLVDFIGRKKIILIGLLVSSLCGFIYIFASSILFFFLLRMLHGVAVGFTPTGVVSYVADISPTERRGEAVGILGMINNVGSAFGFTIGSNIAHSFSIETMFITASVCAIISTLLLSSLPETIGEKKPFKAEMLKLKTSDLLDMKVMPAFIVMTLTVFAYGVLLTIIPDYSIHLGLSEANKGLFMTTYIISSITIRFIAGKLSDRYGRVIVLKVSMLLKALALVMTGIATTIPMFLISGCVLGVAVGMTAPTVFAWAIDLSDSKQRGRGISTLFIALEFGVGLGALSSGFIRGNNPDNFAIVFYLAAFFNVLAWFYMVFMMKSNTEKSAN